MTTVMLKTVSYRMVSMSVTMSMAYYATGSFKAASAFGLANLTVNSAVYFGFEKVWAAWMSGPGTSGPDLMSGGDFATA